MGQYLLGVHHREDDPLPSGAEVAAIYQGVDDFNRALTERGAWVFGGGLMPSSHAKVVDATGQQVLLTDGPFAETKEHLGGFWVIRAVDDTEALEWAKAASRACAQAVELWPLQPDSQ